MESVNNIRSKLGSNWLPEIYRCEIRPLRTRSFKMDIPSRENAPVIADTLLGKEIKVGIKRIYCPDEPMARYLSIFAQLGCRDVAVPYDITKISVYTNMLEHAWQATISEIEAETAGMSPQGRGRVRAAVIRAMRDEIAKIGAGEAMPLFDRSTRQRKS
jgi:hypothetical protein